MITIKRLRTWSSLKIHLLERFQPSVPSAKAQLKSRRQQTGESLLSYYDDIIDLCTQVDSSMPLHVIVDYLLDGVRDDLKIHLERRLQILSDTIAPATFLTIARVEDELHTLNSLAMPSFSFPQPYFNHVTAATHTPMAADVHLNDVYYSSNGQDATTTGTTSLSHSFHHRTDTSNQRFRPCLLCNKSNHRTIDCHRKRSNECFNCGHPAHMIRNCPHVFQ
jgi:hypothetical protein